MKLKPNERNPYIGRPHPVGNLSYRAWGEPEIWKREVMLEFGEDEFIYDVPRLVDGGNLVNLGDAMGGSAILLAQGLLFNTLDGHVHTVDNFSDKEALKSAKNIGRAGVAGLISLYRGTTLEVVWDVREACGDEFDFVFIDADHSYEGVKGDWINYTPRVKQGGLVALHDTNQEYVNKVVEECIIPEFW